ncbi:MAG TPA: hypothetical protein VHN99_06850 [Deinococcales bacterium]|nr:hypothetical protein [Deinococcales bacterium]
MPKKPTLESGTRTVKHPKAGGPNKPKHPPVQRQPMPGPMPGMPMKPKKGK